MAAAAARPVVAGLVTGLPDSATDLAAARLAAAEAVLHERPLHLLSADPGRAASEIRTSHPALPVECESVSGDLADALIDRSRTAHLMVIPAHHDAAHHDAAHPDAAHPDAAHPDAAHHDAAHHSVAHQSADDHDDGSPLHADPFDARVSAHARCPVIIEPAGSAGMVGPVLLGADDEAEEPAVTEYAYAEASVRGVALRVVHIWAEPPDGALSTVDPFAYDPGAAAEDADRLMAEALAGWSSRYPDVRVERQALHHPNVPQAMLRLSADAALMVVGSRHHARLSGQLVGSVTGPLVGRTYCALAVVPTGCTWPATPTRAHRP